MKRSLITALLAIALPLGAQQQPQAAGAAATAKPEAPADKIVAVVNGETITKAKLDSLYERLGAQMRSQYENSGGKMAFLENYVKKRLMIQEALKSGFDQRRHVQMEVDAAKESALFDLYIRDVVAASLVNDATVRKYYDDNLAQFATPEQVRVRHIVITPQEAGPARKTKEEARAAITKIFAELRPLAPKPGATANEIALFSNRFSEAARQFSEDGVAENGGDLGWVHKGINLDPTFAEAVWNIRVGTMSGVVETKFGYHLIFVESRKEAGTEPFDEARASIREFLMNQHGATIMATVNQLTNELRVNSKVAMYPENVK